MAKATSTAPCASSSTPIPPRTSAQTQSGSSVCNILDTNHHQQHPAVVLPSNPAEHPPFAQTLLLPLPSPNSHNPSHHQERTLPPTGPLSFTQISPRAYGSPTAANSLPSETPISHPSTQIWPPAPRLPHPPVRGPKSGIGQGPAKRVGQATPAGAACSARVNPYSPTLFFISTSAEVSTCTPSYTLILICPQNGVGPRTPFAQTTLPHTSRS